MILGSIVLSVVALGLVVVGMRTYAVVVGETHHAMVVDGHQYTHPAEPPADEPVDAAGPVSVNVVAAATVADVESGDSCGFLPGRQPHEADCALPLYVPALHVGGTGAKVQYSCADHEHYEVHDGQTVEPNKQCVLKTAERQD